MSRVLLLGTKNRGKVRELAGILNGLPWDLKTLDDFPEADEPVEDGDSFDANALKKAVHFATRFTVSCLADDSGLVVDALGGAPGIYSARYAGDGCSDADNVAKLLAELEDVPEAERTARFECRAALVVADGRTHIEPGTVEGRIGFECRGRSGFGYDPLFIPEGFDETFAEIDPAAKEAVSHRGRAFRKMRAYLEDMA